MRGQRYQSVHHRHLDVEHHDVDPARLHRLDRLLTVDRLGNHPDRGVGTQQPFQDHPNHAAVVAHQHPDDFSRGHTRT